MMIRYYIIYSVAKLYITVQKISQHYYYIITNIWYLIIKYNNLIFNDTKLDSVC